MSKMNRQASLDILTTASGGQFLENLSKRRSSAGESTTASKFNLVSPFGEMLHALRDEATRNGIWSDELQRDLPKRWEKHGDMIVFPPNCFKHRSWRMLGRRLWQLTAESLKAERLGRKRVFEDDIFNTPHVDLLYGKDGWVQYVDKGIVYEYDVTKRMFNIGNLNEKQRISEMDCHKDIVVDLFAGIGYFTMAYLMKANAKHVYAIDWNEDATEALQRTLIKNEMTERCTVICGDSRRVAPHGVADRVNMGLVPSARPYWLTGCRCLSSNGGILHIHEAVKLMLENGNGVNQGDNRKPTHQLRRIHKSGSTLSRNESLGSVSEESEMSDRIDYDKKNHLDCNGNFVTCLTGKQMTDVNGEAVERKHSGDYTAHRPVQRKISRSASIIEEVENRTLPNARVSPEFLAEQWIALDLAIREFALDCAITCTRYLNNIHDQKGKLWTCTIVNVVKVKSYPSNTDHIVLDLECRPQDEKIALESDLNSQIL